MGWNLVRVSDLPLNSRVLRFGCYGRDVAELQELLNKGGFFFGEKDGRLGFLTEEAVILLQKTFDLRVDGIAGREVFKILKKLVRKTGRIIYTIKKNENLKTISQKFGVGKKAWRRIPGQGNPHVKIYPGMKVLLHQKAFFCWEEKMGIPEQIMASGFIKADIFIDAEGNLNFTEAETSTANTFHLIGTTKEIWNGLLSSPKLWVKLIQEIKKLKSLKYGIDFRSAPPDKVVSWIKILKYITKNINRTELLFIMLPIYPGLKNLEHRLYWLNLARLSSMAGFIMLEPVFRYGTPDEFQKSAAQLIKDFTFIVKSGINNKTLLVDSAGAWDWNLEESTLKKITYKEAKIIRAQNYRGAHYHPDSKFTMVHYFKQNEPHCLVYRTEEGWMELLEIIIKKNFLGIVVRNFNDLGKMGSELILNSFSVLAENFS